MKHRMAVLTRGLMAAALALGLTAPALAASGDGSGNSSGQTQQQGQEKITDAKLQQFAAAYGDIRSVRAEYVPKLQQAEGEQEKARLQKEGQKEMVKAIESNGMGVSEYQRIGRRLNSDKELRERLKQVMAQQGTTQ